MKNSLTLLSSLILTSAVSTSFAEIYTGNSQFRLEHISAANNGRQTNCDIKLKKYLHLNVDTTYSINSKTLIEYASTTLKTKREDLFALGIAGQYALGKFGTRLHDEDNLYGVVYQIPMKKGTDIPDPENAKVNLVFTYPGNKACVISNRP